MTSLEFLPQLPNSVDGDVPEWGTGKLKAVRLEDGLSPTKAPTWHHRGYPDEQKYRLTMLKLSNVRNSDQLLPDPVQSEMHKLVINKPFPAEHPYASHTEKFATIPKFNSNDDPKKGAVARQCMPKNDEMPSNPFDVQIITKTKGFPRRHELQSLPPESRKTPLQWPEGVTDQIPKSPTSGKQVFYPTPPKKYVPNLEERSDSKVVKGNMVISDRTATATRNVERNQWKSTYDMNHTGLGAANPMKLDNLEDKLLTPGICNQDIDQLQQSNVNTFDPVRPMEGRIYRSRTGPPQVITPMFPNDDPDPNYQRPMTLTEREEHRLLHGKEYVNLPEDSEEGEEEPEWKRLQRTAHPEHALQLITDKQGPRKEIPFEPLVNAKIQFESGENAGLGKMHHDKVQQVEAQNRWKLLELQTPAHNLSARRHKVDINVDKSQPKTFYEHEAQYQEERCGLYKTSYDPYKLQYSMNKGPKSGGQMFDISDSHVDALNVPTELNEEMPDAIRWNRTLGGPPASVPQYHDQPSLHEAIEPFNKHKEAQKAMIQPQLSQADVKVQENGVVLEESNMGLSYNTEKFLQESELCSNARNEPLLLMSAENQNLQPVRINAVPRRRKSVSFASDGRVAITPRGASLPNVSLPSILRHSDIANSIPLQVNTARTPDIVDLPVKLEKERKNDKMSRFGVNNQFVSKSSNFTAPSDLVGTYWSARTSYQELHPGTEAIDYSYKKDGRFEWIAGSGTPRPQTTLINMQNQWSKSLARKHFHKQFPEMNPDLRENIIQGRQHNIKEFQLNAQVLRGMLDAY